MPNADDLFNQLVDCNSKLGSINLKLKAEVEKCCPPPVPKPPCNYGPCPTPPKLEEPKHGGNTIPITERRRGRVPRREWSCQAKLSVPAYFNVCPSFLIGVFAHAV
jgi:hypothetical protein